MPDFTVVQRGTDTSGRPVRATRVMWSAWDAACAELGFTPTIVQGGHMGAAGAAASAGTHAGDAFDVRLWDRTAAERKAMIRVFRRRAFGYWERYESQGFDLHAHMIPGPWAKPAPAALSQWQAYLAGRDGLAGNGPDYHWRPKPLVLTPPPQEEDIMASKQELAQLLDEKLAPIKQRQEAILKRLNPGGAIREKLTRLRDQNGATRKQLEELLADVDALAAEVSDDSPRQ